MNAPTGGTAAAPALADFIVLNEEIAALVRARVPLETHLAQVGAELPGKAGDLAVRIGRRLEAGENLASAIETECAEMPAAYRATVLAGLQSGELAGAVESVVDSATRVEQLRRISAVALLYPVMIIILTLTLMTVVVRVLYPAIEMVNESSANPASWLLAWRLPILRRFVVGSYALLILAAVWWWRSGRAGRPFSKRLGPLGWLPGVRGVNRWGQAATFADLLRPMVERGVPLDHALDLVADAIDDKQLRSAAHELAQHVKGGGGMGQLGFDGNGQLRSKFPLLIRLALFHSANRELFVSSLRQAATMYRERSARAAEWYAEYVPILLTVGIGGTLSICFTLLVLWPYTSMLHELAGATWK